MTEATLTHTGLRSHPESNGGIEYLTGAYAVLQVGGLLVALGMPVELPLRATSANLPRGGVELDN